MGFFKGNSNDNDDDVLHDRRLVRLRITDGTTSNHISQGNYSKEQ